MSKSLGDIHTFFDSAAVSSIDTKPAGNVYEGATLRGGPKGTSSSLPGVTFTTLRNSPAPGGQVTQELTSAIAGKSMRTPKKL